MTVHLIAAQGESWQVSGILTTSPLCRPRVRLADRAVVRTRPLAVRRQS